MLCLLYGTYSQSPYFLILFFILSLVVVIGYWTWYIYVNFVSTDPVVFEDQVSYKFSFKFFVSILDLEVGGGKYKWV